MPWSFPSPCVQPEQDQSNYMLEKGGGWRPPHRPAPPTGSCQGRGQDCHRGSAPWLWVHSTMKEFSQVHLRDKIGSLLSVSFPALLPVAKGMNVFTLKQQLPLTGCQARCETPSHIVLFNPHNYPGLLWWFSDKESTCQCRRHAFNPWVGKIPWSRKWQPTPVWVCLGNPMDRRAWQATVHGVTKEVDRTEQLNSNTVTLWGRNPIELVYPHSIRNWFMGNWFIELVYPHVIRNWFIGNWFIPTL